jgi:hypothetical protein
VDKWQSGIRERELMEKRRVAPGWLDVDQGGRMLVPERRDGGHAEQNTASLQAQSHVGEGMDVDGQGEPRQGDGGEELDRAFGGLGLR